MAVAAGASFAKVSRPADPPPKVPTPVHAALPPLFAVEGASPARSPPFVRDRSELPLRLARAAFYAEGPPSFPPLWVDEVRTWRKGRYDADVVIAEIPGRRLGGHDEAEYGKHAPLNCTSAYARALRFPLCAGSCAAHLHRGQVTGPLLHRPIDVLEDASKQIKRPITHPLPAPGTQVEFAHSLRMPQTPIFQGPIAGPRNRILPMKGLRVTEIARLYKITLIPHQQAIPI